MGVVQTPDAIRDIARPDPCLSAAPFDGDEYNNPGQLHRQVMFAASSGLAHGRLIGFVRGCPGSDKWLKMLKLHDTSSGH